MREENVFDRINNWIQNIEYSFVNIISTIAPWLAPLAPAYMSYIHMVEYLEFPVWVSLSVASVVEMLGLATVSTVLTFWNHNRKYSADKNKVSLFIPIVTFMFYLGIILTINVLIDAAQSGLTVVVLARALLTFLTVPAALTVSIRNVLKDVKDGLRKSAHSGKLPENTPILPEALDWRHVSHEDRMKVAAMSPMQISKEYGVTPRTARNWLPKAKLHAENYVYSQRNK